ncbi:MAG: hypothetical protein GXP31_10365 [Kiritimatiellaeota bacterium]|nr:hypothetical protein [Kiritimatiellota bacterium]
MFRTLRPERVYVTEDVFRDPRAVARVERLMTAIDAVPETVSYADLNDLAPVRWTSFPRWGSQTVPRDPDIVLTTGKFMGEKEKAEFRRTYPNLGRRDLWGFTTRVWRPDGELDWRQDRSGIVCQSAWQLHSIMGCPFRCAYCGFGGLIRILVNMEEYVEHLDEVCALDPPQRLYKWDNQTDVSAFEPEYGASKLLVEYFAGKPGKYLEIYVGKSDGIDNLLGLDHRGKTILQWSIAPRTQTALFEKETASWEERIEAARRCQEAGYIVRYRFSPMIPIRNWREEYAELVERIFARTEPDVISLCAFGWMSVADARQCLDFEALDPAVVAAMEAAAPFIEKRGFTSGGGRPIPHDARAWMFKCVLDEIRRRSPTIPVSLCLETVEMWALFQRELAMPVDPEKKSAYYCNCGPNCTPGHPFSKGVGPGASWFPAECPGE